MSFQNLIDLIENELSEQGIYLEDLVASPKLSRKFKDINIQLLNAKIPIKTSEELAYVSCVNNDAEFGDKLFEIFLKDHLKYFPEENINTPFKLNRNIAVYCGLLAHEAAHILEGSFEPLNMDAIFKNLGNENYASELFNIVEDYRIEKNLVIKTKNQEYEDLFNFINMLVIGIPNKYEDKNLKNFTNNFLSRIKNNNFKLSEIINGSVYGYPKDFAKKVLPLNEHYNSIEEIINEEKKFYSTKTSIKTKSILGVKNISELMDLVIAKTSILKGKTVVDSVNVLQEVYNIIGTEFDLTQAFESNNTAENFRQGSITPHAAEELEEYYKENILERINDVAKSINPDYGVEKSDNSSENDDFSESKSSSENEEYSKDESIEVLCYDSDGNKSELHKVKLEQLEELDNDFERTIRTKYDVTINSLMECFEELKLNQVFIERFQKSGSKINHKTALENRIKIISSKGTINPRMYDRKKINKKNYSIYYLIDASGSTSGDVLQVEKEAVCCSYLAIQDLNLEESFNQRVFSYNSDRNATRIFEMNGVNSLRSVHSDDANIDGAAIRVLTKKIIETSSQDKFMFLFADGLPAYNNGVEDTKKAIKEATESNVDVFYFLTSVNGLDHLQTTNYREITKFCRDTEIISNPQDLPNIVEKMFEEYLV